MRAKQLPHRFLPQGLCCPIPSKEWGRSYLVPGTASAQHPCTEMTPQGHSLSPSTLHQVLGCQCAWQEGSAQQWGPLTNWVGCLDS